MSHTSSARFTFKNEKGNDIAMAVRQTPETVVISARSNEGPRVNHVWTRLEGEIMRDLLCDQLGPPMSISERDVQITIKNLNRPVR